MQNLLLHCCCGPCSTQVIERLKKYFELTLYFCNPCIYPEEEYEKRRDCAMEVARHYSLPLIEGDHDYSRWRQSVGGKEDSVEGEDRCKMCIRQRLERTALKAREKNFSNFSTTLTISPHKDADFINKTGKQIAINSNVNFLVCDFKKDDGFKKSVAISKDLGIYRQDYCGCEFSKN